MQLTLDDVATALEIAANVVELLVVLIPFVVAVAVWLWHTAARTARLIWRATRRVQPARRMPRITRSASGPRRRRRRSSNRRRKR